MKAGEQFASSRLIKQQALIYKLNKNFPNVTHVPPVIRVVQEHNAGYHRWRGSYLGKSEGT
jgi:hypothetical protein